MKKDSTSNNRQGSIFTLLASVFRKQGVKPVLIGGYALIASKVQRTTFDIDFIVTSEDETRLEPGIVGVGYSVHRREGAVVQFKAEKPGLRDLDLVLTDKDTFRQLVEEGSQASIAGETFVIPCPKHLIAMKLHAIANNPEREKKDMLDIINLVRMNAMDPQSDDIRGLFKKYGLERLAGQIPKDLP